jgi:hypothetical protein
MVHPDGKSSINQQPAARLTGRKAALAQAQQSAERRPALFGDKGGVFVLLQLPLTAA